MTDKKIDLYQEIGVHLLHIGEELIKMQQDILEVNLKEDNSPFTKADLYSSNEIGKILKQNFNDISIIDEEVSTKNINGEYYFLVDPLDGSKEYIKKRKDFTINIALMRNETPIWGVVYAPIYKELYIGGKDIGFSFYKNNIEVNLESSKKVEKIIVVGSASHSHPKEIETAEILKNKNYNVEFMPLGSSLKICRLALDLAQVYPRYNPTMEWDTAAAHAVLIGSGGNIFDLESKAELKYQKNEFRNSSFLAFSKNALASDLKNHLLGK